MKIEALRLVTEDQIELQGLLYKPETETKRVLLHVHGMAGNFYENKFLDNIAKTLTENKIAFCVFNNRGCELVKDFIKISENKRQIVRIGSAFEEFVESIKDIRTFVSFLEKSFSSIHLSGHSLGSPKTLYYLKETNDQRIKSLILLSPSDMIGLAK